MRTKQLFYVVVLLLSASLLSCHRGSVRPSQGEALLTILNADHLSLVVFSEDSLSRYHGRGVEDLLMLVEEEPKRLKGAIVADKMVGKAAAALMVSGEVKSVYTNLISTPAKQMLERAGVEVSASEEVPMILNRDRSGQCPIDSRLNDTDNVEECLRILQAMKNNK